MASAIALIAVPMVLGILGFLVHALWWLLIATLALWWVLVFVARGPGERNRRGHSRARSSQGKLDR